MARKWKLMVCADNSSLPGDAPRATPPAKRGRPALPEQLRSSPHSIRLTALRAEKLRRLGTAWLNAAIDQAQLKETP